MKNPLRFRPLTLAAMLVLITVIAIPLSYVAQRRNWNLQRKAALQNAAKNFGMKFEFDVQPPKGRWLLNPRQRPMESRSHSTINCLVPFATLSTRDLLHLSEQCFATLISSSSLSFPKSATLNCIGRMKLVTLPCTF